MVAFPDSAGTVDYGLGLYRERLDRGGTFLGHDGEIAGYSAWMGYTPGTRTTILMIGNAAPDLLEPPSTVQRHAADRGHGMRQHRRRGWACVVRGSGLRACGTDGLLPWPGSPSSGIP